MCSLYFCLPALSFYAKALSSFTLPTLPCSQLGESGVSACSSSPPRCKLGHKRWRRRLITLSRDRETFYLPLCLSQPLPPPVCFPSSLSVVACPVLSRRRLFSAWQFPRPISPRLMRIPKIATYVFILLLRIRRLPRNNRSNVFHAVCSRFLCPPPVMNATILTRRKSFQLARNAQRALFLPSPSVSTNWIAKNSIKSCHCFTIIVDPSCFSSALRCHSRRDVSSVMEKLLLLFFLFVDVLFFRPPLFSFFLFCFFFFLCCIQGWPISVQRSE